MLKALRTTLIGGVVFLVPFVILVVVVGKGVEIMMLVAKPMGAWLPLDRVVGVALADIIAIVGVLLICLLAGLAAQSGPAKRVGARLEDLMLAAVPGYSLFKGLADSLADSDEIAGSFTPVLVRFEDYSQMAFEVAG